jgi:FKBP-type peptidyl-prolyl cis-trans isomerase SlyD
MSEPNEKDASRIGPNSRVVVDYTLRNEVGEVLDASDADDGQPIVYVHGYGMLVPGLELALLGLASGDEREVVVPPESGFGEHDDELVIEIDRQEAPNPEKVAVGDELVAESEDGEEAIMRVVEVKDDAVVLDGNHPLAGQTLRYAIRVREIRPATEEEIASAAEGFEAAGYEPPAPPEPQLVQLGRGPRAPAHAQGPAANGVNKKKKKRRRLR